jgi:metal-responsive CopG/Arc/MetJ family transcriptional regulator
MAKYEIVKETSFTGNILYSIEKEGNYVINSCNAELHKVEEYLRTIIINGEKEKIREIIKTIEVND